MKLEELGKVTHGATLSRIEAKPGEEAVTVPLFTMADMSKETGQYGLETESQEFRISKDKFDESLLSKKDMVIIGLTS